MSSSIELGLGVSPVLPAGEPGTPWSPDKLGLRAWYDAELGQPKGVGYVQLDGTSGDYIYTPVSNNLLIAGDIEVVMRVKCNDWTAAASQTLVGRYVTTGNQRSWRFYVSSAGAIVLTASADGTAVTSASITPTVALTDAAWVWLRMRLQLTNGANSVATLDIAADQAEEPTSWTANGSQTAAIIASVFGGTAPLEIGTFGNGTLERFSGQVSRCIVRDGFGGRTIADFDARACYGPGYLNEGSLPTDGGGARYVPLRGVSGDYVWTADKAALRITGDIDVAVDVALADWTPAAAGTFIARWRAVAGNRAFAFRVFTSGVLQLLYSADGSTTLTASSTAAPVVADGGRLWVRATLDVDNGAGGHTITFFTSPDGSSWTQLGAPVVVAGTVSLWAAQESMSVGARDLGATEALAGRVYRAIVRNGIGGTVVADFNAEQATVFGQAADGYGNGWLIADPKHLGNWTLGLPKIYDRSGNGVAPATFGAGSNQPTWLPWRGDAQVYIPGQAGNFVSCPTSAALDITGDVDLRATAWLAALTAAQNQTLVGTMRNGDFTGFMLHVSATGSLQTFHGNGAAVLTTTCPVTLASAGVVPGKVYEFRAAIDVNDGAGNYVVSFYLRQPGDLAWVLLGTTTTAGATSIGASGRACYIGQQDNFSARILTGAVVAASVRNGIDGTVVADFVAASCGQSGYTDTLGNAWAPTRATGGRKAVVQSPVAASARSVILHGTDDYIDVPAAAIPALGAADPASVALAGRQHANPTSFGRIFSIAAGASERLQVTHYTTGTFTWNVFYDGTTTKQGAGPTLAIGSRYVRCLSINGRSPVNDFLNSAQTTLDISGVGALTGVTGARIGAAASSASLFQDGEFEALALRDTTSTATEHGQLTAYYRGGL